MIDVFKLKSRIARILGYPLLSVSGRRIFFLYGVFFNCFAARAQGTLEDYRRAELMKQHMENKIYFSPKTFNWLDGENKFWYLNPTPKGKEFILVDAGLKNRKPAFDQVKLAENLSRASGAKIEPYNLPFTTISFVNHDKEVEFIWEDKLWAMDLATYQCTKKGVPVPGRSARAGEQNEMSKDPVSSPDGKWKAYIKNYNVYIQSSAARQEDYQLSFDGSEGEYYSSVISWAPDSKKLATNKVRTNKPHLVYLIESSPEDQLQPKLHSRNYLKPGDALPQKRPSLFIVSTKKQVQVDPLPISSQFNVSNPVWRKDSRAFTFEYNQRGHQVYKVLEVDAVTGDLKELVKEEAKTFLYSQKKFRYDAGDGNEIIWASERDGWNHLYLYDGKTGQLKNQITKGDWVVRNVVNVNEAGRTVTFQASGREAGQDPYLIQVYKINFDGTGLKALTTENANHLTSFSADYSLFVDAYSRIDLPTVTVLRSAEDGKVIMELEKADAKGLLSAGWKMPEVFNAKGRDGKTDIWGIIVRPSNFDPAKKYPVIEYIYAGPHSSFVPKNFISEPASGDYRPWTALHELAELGFIVVQIDGMGTSNRSKAFHDVCWKNLKDAGFPDRIQWIKTAAQQYKYMDTSRVGIYGNSAGGQNSVAALLFHPEFYKVAVSSSGCHDNRMDKMGWNEQWMGYPVGPEYAESSNVDNAYRFKGQLLLILGEMDTNVPPESTLQLINALIKANKKFDFLMVPGMGHSLGGDYGEHKRRDFFVEHLLGMKAPEWESFMAAQY
jgi:dipeptidyl aminopeptidase/acylaminoacyl peptidase